MSKIGVSKTVLNKEELKFEILKRLSKQPEGLWFNKLSRIFVNNKDSTSRPTLSKALSELIEDKMVESIDMGKGKKTMYKVTESWDLYLKHRQVFDDFYNFIYLVLLKFEFALDTKKLDGSSGSIQVINDFYEDFSFLVSQLYFLADHLSEPFTARIKVRFFRKAHDYVLNRLSKFESLCKKYNLPNKGIEIKIPDLPGSKSDFIYWLKTNKKHSLEETDYLVKMVNNGIKISYTAPWENGSLR
jgi:DNA-binding transcriptional ArsR family regulator